MRHRPPGKQLGAGKAEEGRTAVQGLLAERLNACFGGQLWGATWLVVSISPGRSHCGFPLAGDQTPPGPRIYVTHVPGSQNKRLKVFNNKVETWFVNSLSDSDISKDFICRHCNTQKHSRKSERYCLSPCPSFLAFMDFQGATLSWCHLGQV